MTNQETLVKYITDMYAAESHVAKPLKSQATDEDFGEFPQARVLAQRMLSRSENAMWALESLGKELGAEVRGGFKAAVTDAAGAAAAVINEGRTHAITKKLRDDYTAMSLLSIGYELLHATGNALGSASVASLAEKSLKEVAGLIMELSQEIIPVAVKELAKTNDADVSTIVASQQNIKNAWTSQ